MEYIDLYLVHWMMPALDGNDFKQKVPMYRVWQQMEQLVRLGLVKSIGVSNCTVPIWK